MNEIPLEIIDGRARFFDNRINCRQEVNQKTSSSSQIKSLSWKVKEETVFRINNDFDHLFRIDPYFWKKRIVFCMIGSSSIASISFYPAKESENQMLFIQKLNVCLERKGFLASYLSKEERKEWKALKTGSDAHYIWDEQSISDSIQKNESFVQDQLKQILSFFLKDEATKILGITYKENSDSFSTVCWYK